MKWELPGSILFTSGSTNGVDSIPSTGMTLPFCKFGYILARSHSFSQEHLVNHRLIQGSATMVNCECICSRHCRTQGCRSRMMRSGLNTLGIRVKKPLDQVQFLIFYFSSQCSWREYYTMHLMHSNVLIKKIPFGWYLQLLIHCLCKWLQTTSFTSLLR